MEYPQRKQVRLPCYDYSTGGMYFVTICAEGRKNLFADYVTVRADNTVRPCTASAEDGADAAVPPVGACAEGHALADDSVRPQTGAVPAKGADTDVTPVGAGVPARPLQKLPFNPLRLTEIGVILEDTITYINENETEYTIDHHVIMPNHVHLLISVPCGRAGTPAPTKRDGNSEVLFRAVRQFKSYVAHRCWPLGYKTLWQRSFHEHVVRNEADYLRIWEYIEYNPYRWGDDIYFSE